jgi:hypothetical protein
LSWKTRERKRKQRMEAAKVKRSKREHAAETAATWFLADARVKTCCAVCGEVIRVGDDMVYRHTPGECRCFRHGSTLPDSQGYRPSLRWEKKAREKARRRLGR